MDPSQAEPSQPAPSSEPPVSWQPSAQGGGHGGGPGTGALFNNRPAASLTLGDAITTGFTIVSKPTFIVPVLVIGLVVNAVVSLLFTPVLKAVTPASTSADLTGFDVSAFAGAIIGSVVFGIVGGVLLNLYGQIWAVSASSGPLPATNDVVTLIQQRWIGIIATGLVVGAITVGLLLVYVFVTILSFAAAGILGLLVMVAGLVGIAWVGAKLSMAGWLAAEGANVGDALNGSWRITQGNLLRIVGWGFAYGILFGIVSGVLGAVLGLIPILGPAIAQAIGSALGYGGGVTLYRRTQAAAAAMGASPGMPASSMAS
ncbi:MAG: hypothetical protein HY263_08625 [Chloroflexi bacterium]|nr:hypothetical protein [Chloroflexota bacterium]